jgi:hypothetical protein
MLILIGIFYVCFSRHREVCLTDAPADSVPRTGLSQLSTAPLISAAGETPFFGGGVGDGEWCASKAEKRKKREDGAWEKMTFQVSPPPPFRE